MAKQRNIEFDNIEPHVSPGAPTYGFDEQPLGNMQVRALVRSKRGEQGVHGFSSAPSLDVSRSSDSINLPSISGASLYTTTVTLTGVNMGDFCVISCARDITGLVATAFVSAADTITLSFYNATGSPIDLDVMSIKVLVFPVDFNTNNLPASAEFTFVDGVLTTVA